jgi:hypothetical protein
MKKSIFLAFVGISLLGLSACNSSGNGLDASAGENLADYDDLEDLLVEVENGNLAAEDTSARTGSVSMTGAVSMSMTDAAENLTLIGDLAMTADFDTDTASGTADGFTLFDDDTEEVESDLSGSLAMSGGTISGTDFDATMSGTLNESGDNFGVAMTLDGGFFDNGGVLVVGGDVAGTITDEDGNVDAAEGGFIASE